MATFDKKMTNDVFGWSRDANGPTSKWINILAGVPQGCFKSFVIPNLYKRFT